MPLPPLPAPRQPQGHFAWTVVRIVLQLILVVPSLVILPFLLFGLGLPGIVEAMRGNPLAATPAAIGVLYPTGFFLVVASIFLSSRLHLWPLVVPLLGAVLFALCAYLLYTKANWGGKPNPPHRKEMEIAGIFGGVVLVGAWNAIRGITSLTNAR